MDAHHIDCLKGVALSCKWFYSLSAPLRYDTLRLRYHKGGLLGPESKCYLDLLKRFEEDALDDSPLLAGDDENDGDDLAVRLQGMDIGTHS